MSHALYSTCLCWGGRGGVAKLHGRLVPLFAPPHFGGVPVVAVDYVPEVGMRQIQLAGDRARDMSADEVREADATLRAVVAPAS